MNELKDQLDLVCYRTKKLDDPWTLESYKSLGGYETIKKILKDKISPEDIINQLKTASLRGRGGAGFPTGLKWSFMPGHDVQKYLICNADEGEPGTFKDHDILLYNPHQLIEGMLIAGYVVNASIGYNYLRGEFWLPYERMERALKEATQEGLMGDNILGTGFDFQLHNVLGAGAYIVGEETAMIESLEGKKGQPRFKPPFPANYGFYGQPTIINNVESFASVPVILQNGAEWFLDLGKPNNGGTKIFSVSGHVNNPGNFEIPMGTPFKDLLELAGGMRDGNQLKAVIPGGSSVPVVTGEMMMECDMDYDSIGKMGSMLGSGAVIIMDETTDMVDALSCISDFYFHESCGQCTPCREGTGWLARVIKRIQQGQGRKADLDLLDKVAGKMMGRTICALGDAAAMPVQSFIKHFRHEFEAKVG